MSNFLAVAMAARGPLLERTKEEQGEYQDRKRVFRYSKKAIITENGITRTEYYGCHLTRESAQLDEPSLWDELLDWRIACLESILYYRRYY